MRDVSLLPHVHVAFELSACLQLCEEARAARRKKARQWSKATLAAEADGEVLLQAIRTGALVLQRARAIKAAV